MDEKNNNVEVEKEENVRAGISVSPTSITFPWSQSSQNVSVSCSGSWEASRSESWCILYKPGTSLLVVSANPNYGIARSAVVTITSGNNVCYIPVNQTEWTKSLAVSLLLQNDDQWKDESLGGSTYTIGNAGCLLTSITMLYNYLMLSDYYLYPAKTPSTMNTYCISIGKFDSDGNLNVDGTMLSWGYVPYSLCYVSGNATYPVEISISSCSNTIKDAIGSLHPVIIGIYKGSSRHYVLAYGFNGSSILIRDPLGTHTTLQGYLSNNWKIYSYRAYKKN